MTYFGIFEVLFSLLYEEWIWGDDLEGLVVWGRGGSGARVSGWQEMQKTMNTGETFRGRTSST